jgi:hypothetical protein
LHQLDKNSPQQKNPFQISHTFRFSAAPFVFFRFFCSTSEFADFCRLRFVVAKMSDYYSQNYYGQNQPYDQTNQWFQQDANGWAQTDYSQHQQQQYNGGVFSSLIRGLWESVVGWGFGSVF